MKNQMQHFKHIR